MVNPRPPLGHQYETSFEIITEIFVLENYTAVLNFRKEKIGISRMLNLSSPLVIAQKRYLKIRFRPHVLLHIIRNEISDYETKIQILRQKSRF